jgi:hypothetical protein
MRNPTLSVKPATEMSLKEPLSTSPARTITDPSCLALLPSLLGEMPVSRNIDTTGVWAHRSSRPDAKTEDLRDVFLSKSIEGLLAARQFSLPLPTACAYRMLPSVSDPVYIAHGQRCL